MSDWTATVAYDGHALLVGLSGELDIATAPRLVELLDGVRPSRPVPVVVDATALTFLGVAGLRVLLRERARAHAGGATLVVMGARPAVQRLFALSGLLELLAPAPLTAVPPLPAPSPPVLEQAESATA